jgi:hypothetical protein
MVNIITFTISGNYVKLEGFTAAATDTGNWNGTIHVSGTGNVIESCNVTNSTRRGIALSNTSVSCTINNCTIYNAKSCGILVLGRNNLVTNNDISRTRVGSLSDANGINIDGDGSSTGHKVSGNYIHDILNSETGGAHVDAIQTANEGGWVTNVTIERNHIYLWQEAGSSTVTSFGFMLRTANNWVIKNNLIEAWGGIHDSDGGTALKIYNNTFRSSLTWKNHYWGAGIHLTGGTGHEIKNNIFLDYDNASRGGNHIQIEGGASYTASNNLLWNSDSSTCSHSGYTPGAGDLHETDPKFVSNFTDLQLQSSSPAVDAGAIISGVIGDYDGNSRPQGSRFDIGAYEYRGDSASAPEPPTGLHVVLQ